MAGKFIFRIVNRLNLPVHCATRQRNERWTAKNPTPFYFSTACLGHMPPIDDRFYKTLSARREEGKFDELRGLHWPNGTLARAHLHSASIIYRHSTHVRPGDHSLQQTCGS